MRRFFKTAPAGSPVHPLRSDQALSDWSLGLALTDDGAPSRLDSDELFDGEIVDRSVYELLALLDSLEAYRIDH